ncbi:PTS sugar transporter subunit IIA [bacterium]|nr:PTS sugar transporter subunit IIA [bacterium]
MACRVTDYMKLEWIAPNLKANDKPSVLLEIASHLSRATPSIDLMELHSKLVEREQKASTGADHGVAIPHATIDSADHIIVLFGKSGQGIPFNALDNMNSSLFFAVISPSNPSPGDASYLQLISTICRLMRSASLRERLINASSAREILELLRKEEEQKMGLST